MANIISVDYEAMPKQAASMRQKGKEINSEIVAAYKEVENMHGAWYGVRYNALVVEFNKIVPGVNELLELVVDQIPSALEQVARNYALADRGDASGIQVNKENPQRIVDLSLFNDEGMLFNETRVLETLSNVQKNFKNSIDRMSEYEIEYSKISWQSEAADAFRSKFNKLKTDVTNSFENLNTQFTKIMGEAKADYENTDRANMG